MWKLARKRLLQTCILIFLVSALLVFIRPIYERAQSGIEGEVTSAEVFPFVFWSLFGILLLGPMIAIWRNLSALIMIVADAATLGYPRQSVLRPLLERVLSAVALGFFLMLGGALIGIAVGRLIGFERGSGMRTFGLTAGCQNFGFTAVPLVEILWSTGALAILFVHNIGCEQVMWTAGVLITGDVRGLEVRVDGVAVRQRGADDSKPHRTLSLDGERLRTGTAVAD